MRFVSPDYFATLGIPLRRGRLLRPSDATKDTIMPIVVNETLVRVFFPGVEPLGQLVPSNMARGREMIVGVVGDVAEGDLRDDPAPTRYLMNANIPFVPEPQTIVLRTTRPGDAERILSPARELIARTAPNVAVREVTTMARVLGHAVGPARDVMTLLGLLTGLSLVLGAIGIYGVISQFVARRQRDWGIRVALGLAPKRVVVLVVRHGASLVAAGVVLGVALAVGLTRLLSSFLYGVSPTDPLAMLAAAAALLVIGITAALIPAVRASRTDPAIVLRES
jgi:hypothetical protein